MLQCIKNDELVYANKFDEQYDFADIEGYLFGYSKESSDATYNLNTEEQGRVTKYETINIGHATKSFSYGKLKILPRVDTK